METQLIQTLAPHSVELSTNAKGKVQAAIKVYDDDPEKAVARAVAALRSVQKQLGAEMANG